MSRHNRKQRIKEEARMTRTEILFSISLFSLGEKHEGKTGDSDGQNLKDRTTGSAEEGSLQIKIANKQAQAGANSYGPPSQPDLAATRRCAAGSARRAEKARRFEVCFLFFVYSFSFSASLQGNRGNKPRCENFEMGTLFKVRSLLYLLYSTTLPYNTTWRISRYLNFVAFSP